MAAKGNASSAKFSRWGVAVSNLREELGQLPHVTSDLEAMERLLTQARELEGQHQLARGQSQELTAQLKELSREGEKLRTRLRAHLVARFGPTSEALVRFGFRPLRPPRRTKRTGPTPPAEPTAPTPTPAPIPAPLQSVKSS